MTKVLIVGAAGQLGSALMQAYADLKPVGLTHDVFELESPDDVRRMFEEYGPELVINTAAYHNVDACEKNPERAYAVNAIAVDRLASACADAGAVLAHVGTDYVFDGESSRPYVETDVPAPLNAYGISKLAGEFHVRHRLLRYFIFRTSGLYAATGTSSKGKPFIERMLVQAEAGGPLRVVGDIRFSPSYAPHVAAAIRRVTDCEAFGLYHTSNAGSCSWYEFATEIVRRAGYDVAIEKTSAQRGDPRRPAFSALEARAYVQLTGESLPPWPNGIAGYLAERKIRADAGDRDAV